MLITLHCLLIMCHKLPLCRLIFSQTSLKTHCTSDSVKDARKNRSVAPSPSPAPPSPTPPPPPPADDVGDVDSDQSGAKKKKAKKRGDRVPIRVDMLREMSYSGDDPDDIPTWAEWLGYMGVFACRGQARRERDFVECAVEVVLECAEEPAMECA